mgnify:CR=1 FL=1
MNKMTVPVLAVLLASPAALASDFSPLMWLLLVPYVIAALAVWAVTWFMTAKIRAAWIRIPVRVFGISLVFTPTYTAGGNGQMLSVALYDIIFSGFGADPAYARQALVNATIASVIITVSALLYQRGVRGQQRQK